jgi:DNA replication protein DnaC
MQSIRDVLGKIAQRQATATGDSRWALPAVSDQADTTPGTTRTEPRGDERGALAVCPLCKGAGWLKRYRNGVNILDGATLEPCDCKRGELQHRAWQKARQNSNLPARSHDQTLTNFKQGYQPEAYAATVDFCNDPGGKVNWLILRGEAGTGKTHLAAAIVNRLLGTADWRPLYYVMPDLLDRLRAIAFREGPERDQEWKAIRESSLIVLDDYGTEKGSEWADETLYKLLDYRYANKLPLVVTTNLDWDEMPPRIASRLQDRAYSRVVTLRAGDYRRSKERAKERDMWGE